VVWVQSVHLKAVFTASHKAYDSRRLRTAMAERGVAIGRHRVRTLMRLNGLRPVWWRKFVHKTESKHAMAVSPNVLNRQFEQILPNKVWVCDITPAFAGAGSTSKRVATGCTWRRCWTCIRARSSVGQWPPACLLAWYVQRCRWRSFQPVTQRFRARIDIRKTHQTVRN
jgi:transposase InsO family protein